MVRAPLDVGPLRRGVQGSMWSPVEVVERTRSTNADVAEAARRGAGEGLVVTAEHQVAGRGRLGREWQAPAKSGLAVSVLVRPLDVPAGRWSWLPLLAGVAAHASLTELAGVPAGLKWPNDVLVDGRKIAGILVERIETAGGPAAVIGIGVNTDLGPAELPTPTATALSLLGSHVDRTTLLVDLLTRLGAEYAAWRGAGGDAEPELRAAYERACVTLGRQVGVALPDGRSMHGRATGVDATGRLLVATEHGTQALGAGDVVHLRGRS